jgi:uncharacterized membrane protein (GlpM family)
MPDTLFAHLLLSFLLGGAFIAFCSLAAEWFGTEIGGLIAGLPSTVVVTLLMVALTESPDRAVAETTIIPVVLGLNCLFLAAYALGAGRGAAAALSAALGVWLALAFLAVWWAPPDLASSLLLLLLGFALGSLVLNRRAHQVGAGNPVRLRALQVLARACFGGAVITLGVWLSRTGGPFLGGVASVFPAAGVSTLAIVSFSRGAYFCLGLLRPMMVSGSVTILAYALVVRYTYLRIGVAAGTALALLTAAGCGAVLYEWRKRGGRPAIRKDELPVPESPALEDRATRRTE